MHSLLRSLLRRHPRAGNPKTTISPPLTYSYFHQTFTNNNDDDYQNKNISKNILKNNEDSTILEFENNPKKLKNDQESLRIQEILKLHSTKPPNKVETILSKCGISLNQDLVLDVLRRHCFDWKSAYNFFRFVCSGKSFNGYLPSNKIYNEMLNILGRSKMFDIVNEVFDEMLDREKIIDNETWEVVVHRYAAGHCVEEVIRLFWRRGEMGLEIDLVAFQTVLKWLCRYKHVEEAEVFFHEERGRFEDDIKTWNIVFGGWCVRGSLREAKRFWKDIVALECRPDKYTYGIYINVLSKNGKISTALKLLRTMWAEGCNPDMIICNTVIHGLCFKNRLPEAFELMETMKEKGYELNVVTYNTLIQHLCTIKRMEKVAEVLDEMKQQGVEPNDRTYSFLLSVAKDPEEVFGILERIERSGCKLVIDTYNLLLRLFMEWGIVDRLESTWNEMEKSGVGHDQRSYAIMVHGFYHKEKIEDALLYYKEMISKGIISELKTESLFRDMNEKLKQTNKRKPPRKIR